MWQREGVAGSPFGAFFEDVAAIFAGSEGAVDAGDAVWGAAEVGGEGGEEVVVVGG